MITSRKRAANSRQFKKPLYHFVVQIHCWINYRRIRVHLRSVDFFKEDDITRLFPIHAGDDVYTSKSYTAYDVTNILDVPA